MLFMEAEVREGISWLDSNFPGWRERINLETLDMGSFDYCVVGQLGNLIKQGLEESFLHPWPASLGFDIHDTDGDRDWGLKRVYQAYENLGETWETLLTRQA